MPTTRTITFATPGGERLDADVYAPDAAAPAPAVICVHGGGWKGGARRTYRFLGPWLAAAGYVAVAIDYRLVNGATNRYPAAVDDVRAALAYVREHAAEWNVDPARIALMGDSAGGHLVALAGLTTEVPIKAIVGVFGVYDCAAQWQADLSSRTLDNITADFLGVPLTVDRRLYFEASPLSYVTVAKNSISVLLAWGTEDDIVAPEQSTTFLRALKQAGFYVRTIVQTAPHYWMGDPLDEAGSYSAFFANRLLRFLNERVAV
jgi:acetyl esterase/lipase